MLPQSARRLREADAMWKQVCRYSMLDAGRKLIDVGLSRAREDMYCGITGLLRKADYRCRSKGHSTESDARCTTCFGCTHCRCSRLARASGKPNRR